MSRVFTASIAAATIALTIGVAAQNPPANPQTQPATPQTQPATAQPQPATPPSQPATPSPAAAAQSQAGVTVEGCLVREEEVPGRKPNIAERQGVMEDYIVTSVKMVKGSAPSSAAARADQPTGTSGSTAMYHVKGISDDRLKPLLGKRVQIDGNLQDLDKAPSPGGSQDLPDLQASNIRQVAGDCPAAKP